MKNIALQIHDDYATVLSLTAVGTSGNITNVTTLAIDLTTGNGDGDKSGNICYEIESNETIEAMATEIENLKEMLKTALSTINHLCFCGSENCELCVYDNNIDECDNSDGFKWIYEDKIKKLIGGEE